MERRTAKRTSAKHKASDSVKPSNPRRSVHGYTYRIRKIAAGHGDTVFFVNGKNGVRVLGALSKICSVRDVAILSDGIRFEVPSKHRSEIIALLNNLCYDYKVLKNIGALHFAINTLARVGFAVGIIVVAVGIAIFSQFVTRVSVSAVDGVYGQNIDSALNSQILGILSSYGAKEGKWLPHIDCGSVEKELLALDGVAYASVQRRGTHIEVQIKRELQNDYLVEVVGSTVKARKVAVVTRVIVEGGTAVVEYGDVVRAGDTLIDGYVMYGDERLNVEAKGLAYGKVYHKKTVFFSDIITSREVTNVKRITKLSMFGKTPKTPDSPYEKYELEMSVRDFGFLVPLKIYTYEFREIQEVESENSMSLDEMYASVYSQVAAEFEEPLKVLDVYYESHSADGGMYVTVTVETEEVIS
ncbi:MAG: sporulation protein YqfD [Clostridia bacterium]|nr:sporulation protein YqfD [Clostridia bacterium]